jgi:NitT/TauT family transport system substrate-binding protein
LGAKQHQNPADLKGKKITISRFGSGSDIMTRVALKYWKIDPEKDVSFFQSGNTPSRMAALVAGHMDAALVSSTGVAKIVATGCCRVLTRPVRAALGVCQLRSGGFRVVAQKSARQTWKRFLQALIEGIHTFKNSSELARAVFARKVTVMRKWVHNTSG